MKLADFLKAQAQKAGYQIPEAILTTIPEYDVNDDLVKGVDNGLISIADAKNNHPEIKPYYMKQAMDSADKVLKEILDANPELNEDEELKSESSTFKRIKLITHKVADLNTKKLQATTGKDKQEIQKQIDALQAEIRQSKQALADAEANHQKSLKEFKRDTQKAGLYASRKTVHDTLPANVRNTILDSLIAEELKAAGAVLDLDEQDKLILRRADGTTFYGENNTVVSFDAFVDKTLAKHKQLAVTDNKQNGQSASGANPQPPQGQQAANPFINAGATQQNDSAAKIRQLNNESAAAFQKATSNSNGW